jgi:HAD superfamily hydrolase (TIGR01509 family)
MVELIKALIFDFDGLILDTESSLVTAWQEIYDEYNLVIPLDEWAGMLGQSADPPEAYEYLEAHLGEAVNRVGLKGRRIDRELAILEDQAPMPGVQALIQETNERGLLIAVASSSEHAWVDEHLDRLGLLQYFNVVICADDVEFTKPASDLYIRALHELGLGPEEAIALEDSEHGVSAARAAGLFCIAIPNAITQSASFEQANLILGTLEGFQLDDILNLVSGNE